MSLTRKISFTRTVLVSTLLVLGLAYAAVAAALGTPFDRSAFEAAQKANLPILVAIQADWCATCRTQEPIITQLLTKPAYKDYAVFRVDFDKHKDALNDFGVRWQSTLIVFKGSKELSRSTAAVDPHAIDQQLAQAI